MRMANRISRVGYAFHDRKVDDVSFTRQLAARLVTDLQLDAHGVFATSMSNGGDLCDLMACQLEPLIMAIAPVAGTMMSAWDKSPVGKTCVPIFAVNGTADTVTRWKADPTNQDGWGEYLGVNDVIGTWIRGLRLEI